MKNDTPHNESSGRHHEPVVSSVRNVFIIAGSVVAMVALCLIATEVMLRCFAAKHPMQPMQSLGILVAPDNTPLTHLPPPTLELDDGHADFIALKMRQSGQLNSYGWVDHSNRIARIPIERAMDLIATRGLPTATNSSDIHD